MGRKTSKQDIGVFDITAALDRLSLAQLNNLKSHKYSAHGISILTPLLDPFWVWVVNQVPNTVAPNMLTLIGLMFNLGGFLLLLSYCGIDSLGHAPPVVYLINGFCLFIYQTLDAIDGKQARRLGLASPLGELFDHGMDSISTVLVWLSVGLTMQSGHEPLMLFLTTIVAMLLFYMSHWVHYVTGSLIFGKFDVIELQYLAILTFTITGIMGPQFWSLELVGGYSYREIYYMASLLTAFHSACGFIYKILEVGVVHNKSSIAGTSVLSPGGNIFLLSILAFIVGTKTLLYERYLILYLIYFGVSAAKITNRLIIAAMTKSEIRISDPALWSLCVIGLNQYWQAPINEDYLFFAILGYSIFDILRFLNRTYHQIAQNLNISILFVDKITK